MNKYIQRIHSILVHSGTSPLKLQSIFEGLYWSDRSALVLDEKVGVLTKLRLPNETLTSKDIHSSQVYIVNICTSQR